MSTSPLQDVTWDRMIRAVEKVRERLSRATTGLKEASIPYAVAGGNAVAAWISRIDVAAARNTQDVDILLNRHDLERAIEALQRQGFVYRRLLGIDMFLDGPSGKPRDAVHIVFAGERVLAEHPLPAPMVDESETTEAFQLVSLEALVRMKLNAYRLKDKVHLLDMLDIGLIDASWPAKLPPPLSERLQTLIDNPE